MSIDTFMDKFVLKPESSAEGNAAEIDTDQGLPEFVRLTQERFRQLGFSDELSARLLSPLHHGVDFSMEA